MTPIALIKYSLVAAVTTAGMLTITTGGVEAAAWYFSFMISAGVLITAIYAIYLIAGMPDQPNKLRVVSTVSAADSTGMVPDEIIPLVSRSEYRALIREFIKMHARGTCCGGLSKEEIALMVYNIQHTQQSITTISYDTIEEFGPQSRIGAVFTATGASIRLLMCLAVVITSHRLDDLKCDMEAFSALCVEVRKNPLLRDIYGGGESEVSNEHDLDDTPSVQLNVH